MKQTKRLLFWLLLAGLVGWLASHSQPGRAQEAAPYYVVQPGDTLSNIAYRLGVDLQQLARANNITDPSRIQVGQKLVIPNLEGVQGEIAARPAIFGEDLTSLSRGLGLAPTLLARLNHLVSPAQIFAGRSLLMPRAAADQNAFHHADLVGAESLLAFGLSHGQNPWAVALLNRLPGTWAALPGDTLFLPGERDASAPAAFPQGVNVQVHPTVWVQGRTHEVRVQAPKGSQISGRYDAQALHFFPFEAEQWVALQGVFALATPGLYPLQVEVRFPDGRTFRFQQALQVQRGQYAFERLHVAASLLDPALNKKEYQDFANLAALATPTRYWGGRFRAPVAPPLDTCHPSYFGTRRSYNDTFFWYHTGLDFCGRVGTPIYAPADGVVVFTGQTKIHGWVTMIDHGWGVYTAYCHQDAVLVEKGQRVHAGDLIGKVGRTGRVTGPHLHWEVWVGDVPVDPQEWLEKVYP